MRAKETRGRENIGFPGSRLGASAGRNGPPEARRRPGEWRSWPGEAGASGRVWGAPKEGRRVPPAAPETLFFPVSVPRCSTPRPCSRLGQGLGWPRVAAHRDPLPRLAPVLPHPPLSPFVSAVACAVDSVSSPRTTGSAQGDTRLRSTRFLGDLVPRPLATALPGPPGVRTAAQSSQGSTSERIFGAPRGVGVGCGGNPACLGPGGLPHRLPAKKASRRGFEPLLLG